MIGVFNTVNSFLVFFVLINLGMASFASQGLSYLSGVSISYFLNSKFTFNEKSSKAGFINFFLVQMVMLLLSSSLVFLGVDILGFQYVVVWASVMGVVTLLNFFSSKYFVFEKGL